MNSAAGISFVTPDGLALFLKRSSGSDHAGTWAWPGGGIEENETPQEAATRESSEEIGYTPEGPLDQIDHQADDEVSFTTFSSRVGEHFLPKLNSEHSAYAWAPLTDPPMPLHPGVEATLKKVQGMASDEIPLTLAFLRVGERAGSFAFDRASVRRMDRDGRLHVATTNISKANICPYLGREIPDWQSLGLQPEKIYNLYRDPEELAKAAPSFNNLPVLSKHVEVTADEPRHSFVIGSTGTDAAFDAPYMRNSLVIWDGAYIEAIEDETQKELSSAYRYRADMTSGEIDGVKFDGVMRDIIGNHVALVKEGRAGSDVVVGDSIEELNMKTVSLKAVQARGALAAFLAPRIAKDANPVEFAKSISLSKILSGVTARNFKDKKAGLLSSVTQVAKLAKDDAEGLKVLLDALEGEPVVDGGDPMDDASFDKDVIDKEPGDPVVPVKAEGEAADPLAAIMAFLQGKLTPEDMTQLEALAKKKDAPAADPVTGDDPPPVPGAAKVPGAEPVAKDKEMVTKEDAEKMVKGASDAVRSEVLKTQQEIRAAEKLVRPYVGELAMAHDSASAVLKTALGALNVEGIDKIDDVNALTVILKQQPIPGAKVPRTSTFAADSAASKTFAERHPGAARIKTL